MKFYKYHALGNDYIVIPDIKENVVLNSGLVRRICNRHTGIGADGVLFGPLPSSKADHALHIYNADGSLAEFSGNGTRIFAQFLKDIGHYSTGDSFSLESTKGVVKGYFQHNGEIYMEVGQVEVLEEDGVLTLGSQQIHYNHIKIGNPHCVVFSDELDENTTKEYGKAIENHPHFPDRTNVQFVKIIDDEHIEISIWERGSGYTLASGSSSVAAASVCFHQNKVNNRITVVMPGGELTVMIDDELHVALIGEAHYICVGNYTI